MDSRAQGGKLAWIVPFVVGLGALLPCRDILAEPILTAPHRYIVSRRTTSISALSANQITYTTIKGNDQIDVVVPDRYAQLSTVRAAGAEVLDLDTVAADCAEIMKDPTVASCGPDVLMRGYAIPNDPSLSSQWYLRDVLRDADVEAPSAWDFTTGSSGTLIGVIDSGIYQAHPDLAPNLWTNPNETIDSIDNDSNGWVDDIHGVNTGLGTSNPEDLSGHGSHVSGIIAARGNNGTGISGVMWNASIVSVSVSRTSGNLFFTADIIDAFTYLRELKEAGHNVRVINASFGSNFYDPNVFDAISLLNDADILLVAAAGNESSDNNAIPSYPADYNLPNIISVAATGPTQELAYYSNFGTSVDIAAPGGDLSIGGNAGGIYSTFSTSVTNGSLYAYKQGTSMAAPVVTGALGLLADRRPSLTGAELKSLLLSSADSLPQLASLVNSGRFLNMANLVALGDPVDNCPEDPAKMSPGACGCGVADGDTDGDGTHDCVDSCPTDVGKTSAGVCGCGVSDVDANRNATPDCNDPVLAGVIPNAPTLKTRKGKVTVTMTARSGVLYLMKVTTKLGRKKSKTSYFSASTPSYTISGLKAKTSVTVSYQYYLSGSPVVSSSYSAAKKIASK